MVPKDWRGVGDRALCLGHRIPDGATRPGCSHLTAHYLFLYATEVLHLHIRCKPDASASEEGGRVGWVGGVRLPRGTLTLHGSCILDCLIYVSNLVLKAEVSTAKMQGPCCNDTARFLSELCMPVATKNFGVPSWPSLEIESWSPGPLK